MAHLFGVFEKVGSMLLRSSCVSRAGGPPLSISPAEQTNWVARPCVFCKGGYDAAESVRFGFDL